MLSAESSPQHLFILRTDWVVFFIMLVCMVISKLLKRLDLVLPTLIVIMFKHYLVTFDIEGIQKNAENDEEIYRVIY